MSVLVSGKGIGVETPENVTDTTAGNGLDGAAALPHPERHLEVFTAPHVHLLVVGADFPEVFPVDGEQAPGHSRSCHRRHRVSLAIHLDSLWNVDPEENNVSIIL